MILVLILASRKALFDSGGGGGDGGVAVVHVVVIAVAFLADDVLDRIDDTVINPGFQELFFLVLFLLQV